MKHPFSHVGMIILTLASSVAASSNAFATNDKAQEVLKAANEAAKKVQDISYSARIETSSGKSKRIDSGKVLLSRYAYSDTIGARVAFKGESRRGPNRPAQTFEAAYDGQMVRRVIHSRKVMMQGHVLYGGKGVLTGKGRMLLLEPLLSIDPYSTQRNAESITHVGQKEIDDVLCDVIEINYTESGKTSRLFISVEDHLPRAWERNYLSARGNTVTSIMTITDVNLDAKVDDSSFMTKLPYGYKLEVTGKAPPPPFRVGDIAPDWKLKDSEGVERSLSDYRGKIVLLEFWSTWCPNCNDSMDTMQALHNEFAGQGLALFGVNCRDTTGVDVVRYIRRLGHTYPVLLDGNTISVAYQVIGIPAFYIIGPDGRLLYKGSGFGDSQKNSLYKYVERQIQKLDH